MITTTTPGPWKVRNSVYVENACGRTVADCGMDDNDELPHDRGISNAANARLIANTADLLTGCIYALNELKHPHPNPANKKITIDYLEKIIANI